MARKKSPTLPQGLAEKVCTFPGCNRPRLRRQWCQTHHHHVQTSGAPRPIHPYRKRKAGTVKVSGLRVSPRCADHLHARAEAGNLALGAVIAQILEGWSLRQRARSPPQVSPGVRLSNQ